MTVSTKKYVRGNRKRGKKKPVKFNPDFFFQKASNIRHHIPFWGTMAKNVSLKTAWQGAKNVITMLALMKKQKTVNVKNVKIFIQEPAFNSILPHG